MPKVDRTRIDYMPGDAAYEALAMASYMFPALRTQAIIDKLVITAVSALQHDSNPWRPPYLPGKDRDRWRLPDDLLPVEGEKRLTGLLVF